MNSSTPLRDRILFNHNQTVVRIAPGIWPQHNQTVVRIAPTLWPQHNQTVRSV